MRTIRLLAGLTLLLVPEVLRVYFIMPFPGSQENVATDLRQVEIAFWLHHHVWWLRLFGLALVAGPALHHLRTGGWMKRTAVLLTLLVAASVYYLFNFKLMADRMFLPIERKVMAPAAQDSGGPNDLVIAVERNGQARAYPIELIGYHHQVLDTIGGEAVMVTYCTVCRTGRVYGPVVNGQAETFRLVGMDHYNALFEDSRTGSWWRQVTGECIAGPLKGQVLPEVPSTQLTRAEFTRLHPQGLVMRPDPAFMIEYEGLKDYDEGAMVSSLEGRDSGSWQPKSWVIGVVHNGVARAYDWNELATGGAVMDTLGGDTLAVQVDPRSGAFSITRRTASGAWERIPSAHQEYWHSWRTFHPSTTRFGTDR